MQQQTFYVYIMASSSGTLYTGLTNNVRARTMQHKSGQGSAFTARYHVDRLVYYEPFQYVANAIARGTQIKGWRRSKKIALIESMNPSWRDLSRDFGKEFTPSDTLIRRNDVALDCRLRGAGRGSSLRSE